MGRSGHVAPGERVGVRISVRGAAGASGVLRGSGRREVKNLQAGRGRPAGDQEHQGDVSLPRLAESDRRGGGSGRRFARRGGHGRGNDSRDRPAFDQRRNSDGRRHEDPADGEGRKFQRRQGAGGKGRDVPLRGDGARRERPLERGLLHRSPPGPSADREDRHAARRRQGQPD